MPGHGNDLRVLSGTDVQWAEGCVELLASGRWCAARTALSVVAWPVDASSGCSAGLIETHVDL